jgi:hypothetical protein
MHPGGRRTPAPRMSIFWWDVTRLGVTRSYWDNGRIFSNSGLGRRGDTANRGVDVYRATGGLGQATAKAKRWSRSNPQTQEAWQAP